MDQQRTVFAPIDRLGLTIPFVLYGNFRYLYLVHQKRGGGSPAATLVTDGPLLAGVADVERSELMRLSEVFWTAFQGVSPARREGQR